MPNTTSHRATIRSAASLFRNCRRTLALTDIVWKIVAFVALTPLVTLFSARCWRCPAARSRPIRTFCLPSSGRAALPSLVVLGAMLLAIVALEQAALMAVVCARAGGRQVVPVVALRFAVAHAWPVLRLTARMVGRTALVAAPFVGAVGLTYFGLLGSHDINFYLKERPPVFIAAAGIGGVVVLALTASLLGCSRAGSTRCRWSSSRACPLGARSERAGPAPAATAPCILGWIAGWALALAAISALATWTTIGLARVFVPLATDSVVLLTVAIGTTLLVWALVHLAVNLLGTTTAAVFLFTLYRARGTVAEVDASQVTRFERDSTRVPFALTPRRLVRWGIAGVAAALTIGAFAIYTARLADDVQVAAHRGSSKAAPENSLSAITQAIADAADWVEIDVQETADGEVVVLHDSDFMKVAGVGTKIWDATSADLQSIDIGSRFSPAFKDERVPTLAAVLDACKGKVGVLIELKYYGHDKHLEEKVARLVDERGMASQVAVMSLEIGAVRKMKALRPDWKVGPADVGVRRQPPSQRRGLPGRQRRVRQPPLRQDRPPPGHEGLRLDGGRCLDDVGDDGPRSGRGDHQPAGAGQGGAGPAGRYESRPQAPARTRRRAGREAADYRGVAPIRAR